jgi:hypothetical protein
MVQIVVPYDQSKDIRWYAGEATELAGMQAANTAVRQGEKVAREGNKYAVGGHEHVGRRLLCALCLLDRAQFEGRGFLGLAWARQAGRAQ